MSAVKVVHTEGQDWAHAAKVCADGLLEGDAPAAGFNLGFLYVTDALADDLSSILTYLRQKTGIEHWTGSVGIGICANRGEDVESANAGEYFDVPAVAVMAMTVTDENFKILPTIKDDLGELPGEVIDWMDDVQSHFGIIHGDPTNQNLPTLIGDLSRRTSGFLVGAVTSSTGAVHQVAEQVTQGGVSGIAFAPDVTVATCLSQGCTPISGSHIITECVDNVLIGLDGERAMDVFKADIGTDLAADLSQVAGLVHAALLIEGSDTGDYMVMTSSEKNFAYWFVGGALLTLALLRLGAALLVAAAARLPKPRGASLRLALSNIHRPGSNAASIVVSLGMGLSVLIAVALIEGNLSHQVNERLPQQAPAFFFIDIQPDQVKDFDATVTGFSETSGFKRMPSLRGRIVKINGVAVEKAEIAQDSKWAINGDRALTSSATLTEGSIITDGKWWPAGYVGPPLISLDKGLARGFGVGLGDTLTLNVLGRRVTGTIASLREIDWRSLRFDFAIIFAPGPLEGAPYTHIAAVEAPASIEDALEEAVAARFTNITAIRVREALQAASGILEGIGQAVRGTSLITILAGALVLAGTIAAGQRRRIYTSVVFKVLGATRSSLLAAFVIEFGILGLATGIVAAIIGTLTSWAVMVFLMRADWIFLPGVVGWTVAICLMVTVSAGFFGTWRALGEKASTHLRNE